MSTFCATPLPPNTTTLLILRLFFLLPGLFLFGRRRLVHQIGANQTFFTRQNRRPFVQRIWMATVHVAMGKDQHIPTVRHDRSMGDQLAHVLRHRCQSSSCDFDVGVVLKKCRTPSLKSIVDVQQHGIRTERGQGTMPFSFGRIVTLSLVLFMGGKRFVVMGGRGVSLLIMVAAQERGKSLPGG